MRRSQLSKEKDELMEKLDQKLIKELCIFCFNLVLSERMFLKSGIEKEQIPKFLLNKCKKEEIEEFQKLLCEVMVTPPTSKIVDKSTELLLFSLSSSKEEYNNIRDSLGLSINLELLDQMNQKRENGGGLNLFNYEEEMSYFKVFSNIRKIACERPSNWKNYLQNNVSVIYKFLDKIFEFGEENAFLCLTLICLGFEGQRGGWSIRQTIEKVLRSGNTRIQDQLEMYKSLLDSLTPTSGEETLKYSEKMLEYSKKYIDLMLIDNKSHKLRTATFHLVKCLWDSGSTEQKCVIMSQMVRKAKEGLSLYGSSALEIIMLICYMIKALNLRGHSDKDDSAFEKRMWEVTGELSVGMVELMKESKGRLSGHPNGEVYRTIKSLLGDWFVSPNWNGGGKKTEAGAVIPLSYCLEKKACQICLEQLTFPYRNHKLTDIKEESKFTECAHIVKLINTYTISSVSINMDCSKGPKYLKTFNFYINNEKVSDLSELRNNWPRWKRVGTLNFKSDATSGTMKFCIPVTASNLLFEFQAANCIRESAMGKESAVPPPPSSYYYSSYYS